MHAFPPLPSSPLHRVFLTNLSSTCTVKTLFKTVRTNIVLPEDPTRCYSSPSALPPTVYLLRVQIDDASTSAKLYLNRVAVVRHVIVPKASLRVNCCLFFLLVFVSQRVQYTETAGFTHTIIHNSQD